MFRITTFFQQANYGWTETIYDTSTSVPNAIAHWTDFFLPNRQAVLDPSAQITRVRVSDPDEPRTVQVRDFPPGTVPGAYLSTAGAETFAALLVGVFTVLDHRRNMLLRGIPVEIVTPPDSYNATNKWLISFTQFANALTDGTWAIRERATSTGAPFVTLSALQIGPSPYQLQITTTAPLAALGTPAFIQLKGVQYPYDVNGVWHGAAGVGANTYILGPRRYRPFNILPPWNGSGLAQALTFIPDFIQNLETVRIVKKSTGRPFGLPVGKRRPVR